MRSLAQRTVNTALVPLGAVLLLGAAPSPGTYKIVRDQATTQWKQRGLFCGEGIELRPPSHGKSVTVTVDGEEWRAKGSGRSFGTATCEGTNGTLKPVSRVRDGDWIAFECRSQRVTKGTENTKHRVRVQADGSLEFHSEGVNEYRKDGDLCQSSFQRVTVAVPVDVAAAAVPAEAPQDPCESPGAPSKLVLSPRVFDVKVGGKPVCLKVLVEDANGCALPGEGVRFSVDPPELGAVSDEGCFSPSSDIREEEAVGVVAKLGAVEAAVSARVVPAAEKRAKKTLAALAKTTRSTRAREVLGEVTRGEITLRPLETEPPELPPLEGDEFPVLPLAGAGGAALLATAAGVVLARRRRRNRVEATELQAAPVVTPKKGGGLVCPKCAFEFGVGEATHCPFDAELLKPLERDARQTMFIPTAGGMVCPVCFTRYPTKARFCGHDRAPLVPDFGQLDGKEPKT